MPKRPQKVTNSRRSALKLEALEQRQLFAGGFTAAQGTEFSNIQHPNGNVYDQVLMKTASITVTSDPGQVTRVSFLDPQGDIVQAEFSGAGSLSISLANSTGPAAPTKYNQPDIQYMQGLASFTIQGADATTNFSVFSVGSATANGGAANPIFSGGLTGGDNVANVQRITIVANPANPNGSVFGGLRAGNALFTGDTGVVGIAAANVQVQDVVRVGDIDATGTATPTLVFGTASQFGTVDVQGGDLLSTNGNPINNNGSYLYKINLTAGGNSGGTALPAATTASQISFTGVNPITAAQKTFVLTTGVDSITGTTGDDIISGQMNGASPTLTALDSIDGGAGNDQLTISDVVGGTALPGGLTIKNVETLNYASAGAAGAVATPIDTSGTAFAGLTTINVLQSTGADYVTVGKTQAVTVFDSAGLVTLTGGTSQTVNTKGGVALSGATGAIKVTDTNQAAVASTITGGTTVDVTTSIDNAASGALTIGGATTLAPTGAVTVVSNLSGDSTYAAARTGGAITITGGTTISVTENAVQVVDPTVGNTTKQMTEGAVTITGSNSTTSVTVNQTAEQSAKVTAIATAAVTDVATVQFTALAAGQTIILGGVTYTAPAGGATAKDVATAFANLSSGATVAAAAGQPSWVTGAVTGAGTDTVTFTASAAGVTTPLANTGSGTATVSHTTTGAASISAAGRPLIVQGVVTINDGSTSTDTITTVNLSNYASAAISSDSLTSLTLAGNAGALAVTNGTSTTLDLSLNKVGNSTAANNTLSLPTYTTIKAHVGGSDNSTVNTLTAAAATSLAVDGTKVLTVTNALPATLTTITVAGSAGLSTGTLVPAAVTSIDASATSGQNTVIINPTTAAYTGGTGADRVTITANPTKAIAGGAGTDRLTVNIAGGYNASANTFITGFETLALGALADASSYDATGFTALEVGAVAAAPTFANIAPGTGLTITAAPGFNITTSLKDATGSADSQAITFNTTQATPAASVTAPSIETITVASGANGTTTTKNTLTLVATAATSITVTGAKALDLTNAGNTAVTKIDGSAMTGALNVAAAGTVATTITGGSGDDILSAFAGGTTADVLIGGAGNDMLTANKGLNTLTGGAGGDTFVVQSPGANVNTYSAITDASVGDVIRLANQNAERFGATKLTLQSTAVFQDYANAVVNAGGDASAGTGTGYVGWFQFGGDTYIVESLHNAVTTPDFQNGTDLVVKLTGAIDLSAATFLQNTATGAPEVVIR